MQWAAALPCSASRRQFRVKSVSKGNLLRCDAVVFGRDTVLGLSNLFGHVVGDLGGGLFDVLVA